MSATVMPAEQLEREQRLRPRFAAVAVLAGVLLFAAALIQTTGAQPKVQEATLELIYANRYGSIDLVAAIVNAIATLAIGATLVFLFDAARARNPQAAAYVRIIAVIGALLVGITGLIYTVVITQKAHQFVTTGDQTYTEAHQLTTSGGLVLLQLLGLLGALLVALSLVLISMQAMRVGLLTRFMGYVGMISGALVIFTQLMPVPIVETFWFIALGVLFLGRWPSGEPAAWRTGRAERWPSSQELREQRIRAAGGPKATPQGGVAGRFARALAGPAKASEPEVVAAPRPAASSSPRSGAKRKRKRRR